MNRLFRAAVLLAAGICAYAQGAPPAVTISSHIVQDNTRAMLIDVRQETGVFTGEVVDEVRCELPRNAAADAILQAGPKDWKLKRDGHAVLLSGTATHFPLRIKILLFDLGTLEQIRTEVRLRGRVLLDARVLATELPPLQVAGSVTGFLNPPAVMEPGDTVEMKVLDPIKTPADGQWIVAGVPATAVGVDRIRAVLPNNMAPAEQLRISYFNSWGERVVDALSIPDVTIAQRSVTPTDKPRITGCARVAFIGQFLCVCGDFPVASRSGIRIDGQPASVISSSRYVILVALPQTLAPGPHVISGDPNMGFSPQDKTTFLALLLTGSLDADALFRGQNTTMRLGVLGTTESVTLAVVNHSPGVISLAGGNYQEITTPGGPNNVAERRVDAIARGDFSITYSMDVARCPCEQTTVRISTASQTTRIVVPRRILATVTLGTPAAMYANAQAVAIAHGMAVIEVDSLSLTGEGLALFEILDGTDPIIKAAELAQEPRVSLAQPDFVYDASSGAGGSTDLIYGPRLIGADIAERYSQGKGITIGVIDTGIDSGSPSLRGKIAGYSDVTGTGWTPDVHGSLVAGIITGDNPSGPSGIAPGAKILGVKSCVAQSLSSASASCWSSTLARGIDLASQKNVQIMNLSVGGPEDRLLGHLVEAAINRRIVVVSAAGNDGPEGKPSYPAAVKGVDAITAVDAAEHLYPQATRGNYVSVAAPGVDILSTAPGGRTQVFSGTSAAAAFASGSVALLLERRPALTPQDLQTLLQQTATPLGPANPNSEFGYGLLNVCRAMAKLTGSQLNCR